MNATVATYTAPCVTALIAVASRAVAFVSDKRCPRTRLVFVAVVATLVATLCFPGDIGLAVALGCALLHVAIPLVTEGLESRIGWRMLLLPLVVLPFLLPPELSPRLRDWLLGALDWVRTKPVGSAMFSRIAPRFVLLHAAGMLLCLSDGNLLLRSLLRALGVAPPAPSNVPVNPAEYLRGGLVGAIERLLIYVFAANSAFNAIAFVITVKGIVRYQEIVKHHSAEYVLIGTLLSTLTAMLLGLLIAHAV